MFKYAPNKGELASRDVVSRAEWTEILEGRGVDGCVLLDMRHLGREKILERLPQIRELALDATGKDAINDADSDSARRALHDGRHRDRQVAARRSMPGVYAAGECACVSVHGANRLGGNSLLETIVFGARSAQARGRLHQEGRRRASRRDATLQAEQERDRRHCSPAPAARARRKLRHAMNETMSENTFIFRDAEGLAKAVRRSARGARRVRRETCT